MKPSLAVEQNELILHDKRPLGETLGAPRLCPVFAFVGGVKPHHQELP